MALDGLMLKNIINELSVLQNSKINKIYQISSTEILFNIRATGVNVKLLISINANYARINLTSKEYYNDQNPSNFTFVLRKHFENGTIIAIEQYENDRIALFKIKKINELGDINYKYLIIELFSKDSNIIITDETFLIIDCLKKSFSLDSEKRKMISNTFYIFPETENKLNPFKINKSSFDSIVLNPNNFIGLTNNFFNKLEENKTFENFVLLLNKKEPVVYEINNKIDFYNFPIDNCNIIESYTSFNALLDHYFYQRNLNERLKQKTNSLSEFINKKRKSLEIKLNKLENQLLENQNYDFYKVCGELILNNLHCPIIENNYLLAFNYIENKNEKILLDLKFSLKKNSSDYFTKYRKKKNSILHIKEQISLTIDEISYFKNLDEQLKYCSIDDALQIKDELTELKYLKEVSSSNKKKKNKISILTYVLNNGVEVLVGKNNLQNDYITNKISKKEDYFFHVKDFPSCHILCKTSQLDEYTIRSCAKICIQYSKFSNSSSVAVIYTQIKFISKIKSFRNSFVKYKNEKTIFIDPEEHFIENLKKINH